jgi:cytochrome c oxidase subunit 2
MNFFVVADPPAVFEDWMTKMAEPAPDPTSPLAEQGRALFLSNTCIGCHTIRGTIAQGALGPDLTHLATRETLAAGTIPLTHAGLRDWILDPQSIKPGVTMPPTTLTAAEVRAIVAYLLGLGFRGDA